MYRKSKIKIDRIFHGIVSISFFCQGDFQGNFDRSTVVAHDILATGMIFRIYPKSWYTQPSLRLELYGCSLGNSLKS